MCFFFQAEDGIRDTSVTGVQTCALPISGSESISGGKKLGVGVSDKHGTAAHEPSRDRCLQRVIRTAAAALTVQVQSRILWEWPIKLAHLQTSRPQGSWEGLAKRIC